MSEFESLLERMKRLVFAKPVTFRLTPGCNDYTNPNTNPTRPSRHLTGPRGDHRGKLPVGKSPGEITGGVHWDKATGGKSPASAWNSLDLQVFKDFFKFTDVLILVNSRIFLFYLISCFILRVSCF